MIYERYPTALDVELTSACNMKCVMCPRSKPGFKNRGHMSDRIFGRLHRELSQHAGTVRWIWLHVGGESLLHPRFVEWVNALKRAGIGDLGVSTNVTPLTRELSLAILSSGLHRIVLSVDGTSKTTYEALRVGASYEDVIRKLERFLALAKDMERRGKRHPAVWLQCLRMDDTKGGLRKFAEAYGEGEIAKFQRLKGFENGRLFMKYHETFAAQVKRRGSGWDGASGAGRRFSCRKPFGRATVLADGSVVLCCYDVLAKSVMGTLETNSLGGIWRSARYNEVRAGFNQAQKKKKAGQPFDNDELFPKLCRPC